MLDPILIIKSFGLLGIFLIVFIESGLLVGFFLPGDTLLFASGIFASQGFFSISLLVLGASICAILGDNFGYWTGKKFGRKLFERSNSTFFNKERVYQAERFYEKYGRMSIVMARFVPVVRTFAPIIAGVANMPYKIFFIYNIIGGILWVSLVSLLGYYFGSLIPNIDSFLFPIFIFVIVLSFSPFIVKFAHKYTKKFF